MEKFGRCLWSVVFAICLGLMVPQFIHAQEAPVGANTDQSAQNTHTPDPAQSAQTDTGLSPAASPLTWNTFAGSATADYLSHGVTDAAGNIYLVGTSSSTWGTPVNAFSSPNEAVVAKYNSNGVLLWNTFLGSNSSDTGSDITVDSNGKVYVIGSSWLGWGSPVRPFTPHPNELRPDIFVARLSSGGVLEWLTFLGGTGNDRDGSIALNGTDIFVSGTSSEGWGSPNRAFAGSSDVFAARLNNSGALQWHTFLGSASDDVAADLVTNGTEVYVAGSSSATWGSPIVPHHGGLDAMVTRLNTSGTFVWNTFVGGTGDDEALAMASVGASGVILGGSSSATWGNIPFNRFNGGVDGMIAQVNPQGAIPWNTFLGSPGTDVVHGVGVDSNDNIFFAGTSDQTWGAPVNAYTGATEAVTGKLNSGGAIQWNSFLGSTSFDEGGDVAPISNGRVVVFGESSRSWGTPVRPYADRKDIFVALLPDFGSRFGQTITFPSLADRTVGDPPVSMSATATSGLPVTYAASGSCTVQGNSVSFSVAGYCTVVANQEGNVWFAPAIDQVRVFNVAKGSQTIDFPPIVNKTLGDPSFSAVATATSGLPVSFSSTTPTICTVLNTTISIIAAGTCSIVASQAGNEGYNAAINVGRSFSIAKANQTIFIAPLAGKVYGDPAFLAPAFASSGLPVSLASTTIGKCTVSGYTVTLVAAGTCTLVASQAGNGNFNAAADVSASFAIAKASQIINFAALPNKTIGNPAFAVNATATSDLSVSFASTTTGKCTVSGSTVTLVAAGTCTIVASQAGNGNYNAAANVSHSFTIAKANQTINFAALPDKALGNPAFAVSATATSGLAVSFASTTTGICTVSGSTVTLVAAGTCTIVASQAGNGNYNAAANVSRSFAVTSTKTNQTINFAAPPNKTFGNPAFAVSATATSGLPVSFASTTTGVCTVSGSTVTLVAVGTCTIVASQAGNGNYNAAADVSRSFSIAKANQTINFAALTNKTIGDPAFAVSATATSGLAVTFASTTTSICTVNGKTVSLVAQGTCTIRASQSGNGNYNAAANVDRSFSVLAPGEIVIKLFLPTVSR